MSKELRGLIVTYAGLWLLFTVAALVFGAGSVLSFTDHFSFADYVLRIHERWRGEYVYFFGSTAAQSIVFALQLGLVLNWDSVRSASAPAGPGRARKFSPWLSDVSRNRFVATMPLLAFINAIVRFEDFVAIHRIVARTG